jgi:hypothetical protein
MRGAGLSSPVVADYQARQPSSIRVKQQHGHHDFEFV